MTNDPHLLIARYFRKEMSEKEVIAFRDQLKNKPEWRAIFQVYQLAAAAHHQKELSHFKYQFDAESTSSTSIKTMQPRTRWWLIAASITLLLSIFSWLLFSTFHQHNQDYFARYNLPELFPKADYALVDDGLYHKGVIDSNEFSHLKLEGLQAYKKQQWDKAIQLLNQYALQTKPSAEELPDEINLVYLYIGRAWLEQSENGKAIAAFQKADAGITDPDNYGLLQELIRWQLVLGHLKNKDFDSAKQIALLLRNAQHETIKSQANHLLNELP